MSNQTKKMQVTYSFVRVLACLFVVIHHYMGSIYPLLTDKNSQTVALVVDNLLMCNNVLFFMLSGKFALENYKGNMGTYYKKKVKQILLPFFIASVLYYVYHEGLTFSLNYLQEFFVAFMGNEIVEYLWFVYALIGFYLVVPFLTRMMQGLQVSEKRLLLAILVIFITMNNLCEIFGVANPIGNYAFCDSIAFCLIGYLIEYIRLEKIGELVLYILGISASLVSTWFIVALPGKNPSINGLCLSRILMCGAFYVAIIRHTNQFCEKMRSQILFIAGQTYYIYLIHALVQEFVSKDFMNRIHIPFFALKVCIGSMLVFLISMIFSWIIRGILHTCKNIMMKGRREVV